MLSGLKRVIQHLLLGIPIYDYIIQIDSYGKRVATQLATHDAFNCMLEIERHLNQAYWHPEPSELALVYYKG